MSWFNGKLAAPDVQWFAEIDNQHHYTPDVNMLEQRQYQHLFLYGEDRPDLGNNMAKMEPFIADSPAIGFTRDHFSMYEKKLGKESFPIALQAKFGYDAHTCIKGYLVSVEKSVLYNLDNYRRNGDLFQRIRTKVLVPYTRIRWIKDGGNEARGGVQPPERAVKKISAWMYVGVPEYWNDHIDAGYHFSPVPKIVSKSPWMEDYIYYEPG